MRRCAWELDTRLRGYDGIPAAGFKSVIPAQAGIQFLRQTYFFR
ncbi:hypothetical protein J2X54_000853 [Duganella sp. 3397]|nr:hypothetical protein [Duganella sp. 3397]